MILLSQQLSCRSWLEGVGWNLGSIGRRSVWTALEFDVDEVLVLDILLLFDQSYRWRFDPWERLVG